MFQKNLLLSQYFFFTILIDKKVLFENLFNFNGYEEFSSSVISLFVDVIPFLYAIAVVISNISLIIGGLTYLLDEKEENGKWMIIRALSVIGLFMFIFNDTSLKNSLHSTNYAQLEAFTSFLSMYLVFIFATLSLIYFTGNCGLYLLNQEKIAVKNIKKSIFCLLLVILPLGNHFPEFPKWKW